MLSLIMEEKDFEESIKDLREELGRRIRHLREGNGWTQKELADYAGVHFNTISKIEIGKVSTNLEILGRLAIVFDVKPYQLIW
jgi:transcriptional regulator with XRE-family HTH domain